MTIQSMAVFSGETARLELSAGLNIIQSPQGGAQPWSDFLLSMFYGGGDGLIRGELTLLWEGRSITLRRDGGFSAVYAGTEDPVPGLTEGNCGAALCGLGREDFVRMSLLWRLGPGEQREENPASQEYDAALAALERLRARSGQLPPRDQLKRGQGELQYLKALDEEIRQAKAALKQAEQAALQAAARLRGDRNFDGLSGDEALDLARREAQEWTAHASAEKKWAGLRPFVLLPGLALGGGLTLWAWLVRGTLFPYLWGGLGLFGSCGILLELWLSRRCAGERQAREELLERWAVQTPEELLQLAQDYAGRWRDCENKAEQLRQVREALSENQRRREQGKLDLLDFVHSFAPEARDLFGCSAALSRALNQEERLHAAQDRLDQARRRAARGDTNGPSLSGSGAPLVVDGGLDGFDEGELTRALEALSELAQRRQVLLFTRLDLERLPAEFRQTALQFTNYS